MPSRLPVQDIFAGLVTSIGTAIRYWFHYTLVAFAWLGVVPLTACKSHHVIVQTKFADVISAGVIRVQHSLCWLPAKVWKKLNRKWTLDVYLHFRRTKTRCYKQMQILPFFSDWRKNEVECFLFFFSDRSNLQVFIYRLCELSPYLAIRYAFNVRSNYSLCLVLALCSHTVMFFLFHILLQRERRDDMMDGGSFFLCKHIS